MGKVFLFESDVMLANRMGSYWSETEGKGFEYEIYTSEVLFLKDAASIEADVWLVDELLYDRFLAFQKSGIILKFTKNITYEKGSIFKYQSMEILQDMIGELLGVKRTSQSSSIGCKVYALYSPSGCKIETTISLELAQLLSKKAKTLYINLKPYCDLEYRTHQQYTKDICDLLLYLEEDEPQSIGHVTHYISVFAGVDILVAPRHIDHITEVTEDEWLTVLERLEGIYDYIVIELSNSIRGLYSILNSMECIITCIPYGEIFEQEFNTYWNNLECLCENRVKERTVKYNLEKDFYMGDYHAHLQYMNKQQMVSRILMEVDALA